MLISVRPCICCPLAALAMWPDSEVLMSDDDDGDVTPRRTPGPGLHALLADPVPDRMVPPIARLRAAARLAPASPSPSWGPSRGAPGPRQGSWQGLARAAVPQAPLRAPYGPHDRRSGPVRCFKRVSSRLSFHSWFLENESTKETPFQISGARLESVQTLEAVSERWKIGASKRP